MHRYQRDQDFDRDRYPDEDPAWRRDRDMRYRSDERRGHGYSYEQRGYEPPFYGSRGYPPPGYGPRDGYDRGGRYEQPSYGARGGHDRGSYDRGYAHGYERGYYDREPRLYRGADRPGYGPHVYRSNPWRGSYDDPAFYRDERVSYAPERHDEVRHGYLHRGDYDEDRLGAGGFARTGQDRDHYGGSGRPNYHQDWYGHASIGPFDRW